MDFSSANPISISNFSAHVSGMAVSDTSEESEEGGHVADPERIHFVYQSCLADLVKMVRPVQHDIRQVELESYPFGDQYMTSFYDVFWVSDTFPFEASHLFILEGYERLCFFFGKLGFMIPSLAFPITQIEPILIV